MAVRRKKSAETEEVPVSVEETEYVEETVTEESESSSEESAPRRRGAKPLELPALAKEYEKASRVVERLEKAQEPARERVSKLEEKLAAARAVLDEADGSALEEARSKRDEAKAALDAKVAELTA
jgi:hypothetical protein